MIEVEGLTRRYGETTAVDDLSFTAANGEVTGFVGPNGAGKTTTMRMVLGLERPDAGRALVDGVPYARLAHPSRSVGALLDAGWGQDGRTARGHLTWIARTAGLDTARVDELLDEVGLTTAATRRIGDFSLGMRQRLGLAAAMLGRPSHLVLDEPLNGLDPEGVHWMRALLRDLAARGHAVLVSSHLLAELAMAADSLVVVGAGRLVGQYSTEEFVSSAGAPAVRVRVERPDELRTLAGAAGWEVIDVGPSGPRDPGGALTLCGDGVDATAIARACAARGLLVTELTPVLASLEEAFLTATGDVRQYRAGDAATRIPATTPGVCR